MKTVIDDWLDSLEIEKGPETVERCCETGDPVITLMWTRKGEYIKHEGEGMEGFSTPQLAWQMFLCAFDIYRKGKHGKIYWRRKPIIESLNDYDVTNQYAVFARLFIAKEA